MGRYAEIKNSAGLYMVPKRLDASSVDDDVVTVVAITGAKCNFLQHTISTNGTFTQNSKNVLKPASKEDIKETFDISIQPASNIILQVSTHPRIW